MKTDENIAKTSLNLALNVLKNIDFVKERADAEVVTKVREIIGDQFRVSWKNS